MTLYKSDNTTLRNHLLLSPLRYPGGKARLATLLASFMEANGCKEEGRYYEPFAGGSGAALRLLGEGRTSELFLNDADPCIYAFWSIVLSEPDRFVECLLNIPLTIDEWRKQRSVYAEPNAHSVFDVGFATFYLNRCNRSGILSGAGPIGGYSQEGKWRLDARFNKKKLIAQILSLKRYRDSIHFYNLDAIDFLTSYLPRGRKREEVFVYLDPPYYYAGKRLYLNYYKDKEHLALAKYILRQKTLKWVMTYDRSDFIGKIYNSCDEFYFSLRYSLQKKQEASELLVVPRHLTMPDISKMDGSKYKLKCA